MPRHVSQLALYVTSDLKASLDLEPKTRLSALVLGPTVETNPKATRTFPYSRPSNA